MKLKRCYIGRYRVLRRLSIDFSGNQSDGSIALDFLVGPNGCGKSTLLQALAEIFKALENNIDQVSFPFMLEYELRRDNTTQTIYVANCNPDDQPDGTPGEEVVRVNGSATTWDSRLLPKTIAILTTGREEEWRRVLFPPKIGPHTANELSGDPGEQPDIDTLTDRALHELPGLPAPAEQEEAPEVQSGVHFIPSESLSLVTLCAILVEMSQNQGGKLGPLEAVFADANIGRVCGFALKFRLNEGIATELDRNEIAALAQAATRAVHLGSDRLLYFDLTTQPQQQASRILSKRGGSFALYNFLMRLCKGEVQSERVLQEVTIFLQRATTTRITVDEDEDEQPERTPLHMLAWLSDGERSFLGRMSLFSMLRGVESLILLDEPEVHFNDYWKRQIVFRLEASLKDQHSHALITTHSSITLTDVPSEDILILHRGDIYTEQCGTPRIPTLAADPSDIIVHVFQAPYATGAHAVHQVRRILDEVGDQTDAESRKKLERLKGQVGAGYWSYRIRRALHRFDNNAA